MNVFRHLNPFTKASVHQDEVVGARPDATDVQSLHADVSQTLLDDLEAVAATGETRVRYLIGPPGVGKSHLFSRLRRQLPSDSAFAFASQPPTRPESLSRWVLDQLMKGLQSPRFVDGKAMEYSQLDSLIYRLILDRYQSVGWTEAQFHHLLADTRAAARNEYLEALKENLPAPDLEVPVARALMSVLREETRRPAIRWLSGATNMTDDDLASLEQRSVLEDEDIEPLLNLIGRLARVAKLPLVLALDQLDEVVTQAQIIAFDKLLITLIDKSYNWYAVIALLRERYEAWLPMLSGPLKSRVSAATGGQMPILELSLVRQPAQKRELLVRRLASSGLQAARVAQEQSSPLFPLTQADVDTLSNDPQPIAPRALLSKAAQVYKQRVGDRTKQTLADAIRVEYEAQLAEVASENLELDRAAIADRVSELVRLVALHDSLGEVETAVGPLEGHRPGDGTHNVFRVGDRTLHIVGHHMQRGQAFPSFAKRLLALEPGAIFLRTASARVAGKLSVTRFQEVCQRHTFVSLTAPMHAELQALGQMLANLRAGDFRALVTDPPPEDEAVLEAIAGLPGIETMALAEVIRGQLKKSDGPAQPESKSKDDASEKDSRGKTARGPTDKAPLECGGVVAPGGEGAQASHHPPETLVRHVREIMRPARWLALDRLRLQLSRRSIDLEAEQLRGIVQSAAFRTMLELHPVEVPGPGIPQILIYIEEEHA